MKRAMWLPALLALGLVACGGPPSGTQTDAPTGADAADATGTEAITTTAAASDEATTDSAAAPTAGSDAAESPTADPTVQALANAFELPRKGDDDAPLVIFEFSDYL